MATQHHPIATVAALGGICYVLRVTNASCTSIESALTSLSASVRGGGEEEAGGGADDVELCGVLAELNITPGQVPNSTIMAES